MHTLKNYRAMLNLCLKANNGPDTSPNISPSIEDPLADIIKKAEEELANAET
jgi:hypothetical protein